MKKARLLLIIFVGFVIFHSCVKPADIDFNKMTSPVYTGEWAVPLATSHITLKDVIASSTAMITDPTSGLISFTYHINNLTSTTADVLMKIPNQSLPVQNFSFNSTDPNSGLPLSFGPGIIFPYTTYTDVPLTLANSTQKLDSIYVKSGTITIPITSNFNKSATITLSAPNIINKTTRVKIPIPVINLTPTSPNTSISFDVSNCIIILKNVNSVPNTMHFDINMNLTGNANPTLPVYSFNMGVNVSNLSFSSLYGNLGQFSMDLSQNVNLDFFKTNLGGGFQFGPGAINLTLNIDNSFGIPVQVNTTTFNAHSDVNSPYDIPIKLFGPALPNTINILAPAVFGQTKTTTVVSTNPNIADAFNISPTKIVLVANALTNAGNPGGYNFVKDNSMINMNMDVALQLFASISNFTFQDTVSFNLTNIDKLQSAAFRINTTNGFPLGVKLQAYFVDASYHVLDAMFTEPLPDLLKPAVTGGAPNYKTVTPTSYQFPDIVYDQARLTKIQNAKKIIIKLVLNTDPTANSGLIKIYDSYYFDSSIAVKAKANISSTN